MRYREKLNIIFMRDNGPRRSLRVRRSRFYLGVLFFSCLPFVCVLLAVQCWSLWLDNEKLRQTMTSFETDCQAAQARAERLENLEALLLEENTQGRELILRHLAAAAGHESEARTGNAENQDEIGAAGGLAEGPGHEDFPSLDTGRVKVGNVQIRAQRGNALRIGLDLRNPDNEAVLSGEVSATLVPASGEEFLLVFTPREAGGFRINRFKRAVMLAHVPRETSLVNAQVILEVRSQDGEPYYRNIFAVQR